ncbi:MAG TPA: hypothetical protein VH797_10920 [Nitrososphaeraceae archaeon]|jgi:hypothetical protein
MTSNISEILFIAESYHYLKTPPLYRIENRNVRRRKLERQARKAIMKFSRHDMHSLTNYSAEEQLEMTAWIHLAISECSKIRKESR